MPHANAKGKAECETPYAGIGMRVRSQLTPAILFLNLNPHHHHKKRRASGIWLDAAFEVGCAMWQAPYANA